MFTVQIQIIFIPAFSSLVVETTSAKSNVEHCVKVWLEDEQSSF